MVEDGWKVRVEEDFAAAGDDQPMHPSVGQFIDHLAPITGGHEAAGVELAGGVREFGLVEPQAHPAPPPPWGLVRTSR
ncbi:hypothetical protein [Nocardia amikacinitolerans]|uniref:hypothetical protein n=1 Tax=Nocardia amikacinitolerans TaxID=756689 RepID=UPI0020A2AB60|nr:hypothetical protein [Nocardia amikacinitolerans]